MMSGFNKSDKGKWIEKDPSAVLDYSIDWTNWLQTGETVLTSTWNTPTGITKHSESTTTKIATVWLAGGANGREYTITNRVITSNGRQDERSFIIVVKNR